MCATRNNTSTTAISDQRSSQSPPPRLLLPSIILPFTTRILSFLFYEKLREELRPKLFQCHNSNRDISIGEGTVIVASFPILVFVLKSND